MVRLTLIARLVDGLPLAEGLDTDKDLEIDSYKGQAKVGPSADLLQTLPLPAAGLARGVGGGRSRLACSALIQNPVHLSGAL